MESNLYLKMEASCFLFASSLGFVKTGKNIGLSAPTGHYSIASRISRAQWPANNPVCAKWRKNQRYELGSTKCSEHGVQLVNVSLKRKSKILCLPKSYEEDGSAVSDSARVVEVQSSNEVAPSLSKSRDDLYAEPSGGKSGTVSFNEPAEMGKLDSLPAKNSTGNFIWIVAPLALIASFLLPQFVLNSAIYSMLQDDIVAELLISISSEVFFYSGLLVFLKVTEHVQRPHLVFSSNQWDLITGLKGYLYSSYFTTGFRVFAPLLAVYVVWPAIGLPALISVAPFLIGWAAQFAFEAFLEHRKSSCWPVVPIIFEVYRLYQLSKAANFIEKLMMEMKGMPVTPELVEKSGALFSLIVVFQVLGLLCLWSLLTFLLRLFPSKDGPGEMLTHI